MAPLRVAVCTNRPHGTIRECLSKLSSQLEGRDVLVVASGLSDLDVAALKGRVDAHLPGARILTEARPGLSRARNRALRECEDGDVLAFIDDDAIVQPGWHSELSAAWGLAEADVACIGGPIEARFDGARPPWLSDSLLPVLTVLDLGGAQHDLDPATETVYGANISFRCGPLRQTGGFDPAFGHDGERLWFSEEDQAQRALARAGHRIRYVPGPRVWHVIDPARLRRTAFLRRRYQYGATLGVRRGRDGAHAARQAATSAFGAAVAGVRRDPSLTMERATRVAENLGVLAGRRRPAA